MHAAVPAPSTNGSKSTSIIPANAAVPGISPSVATTSTFASKASAPALSANENAVASNCTTSVHAAAPTPSTNVPESTSTDSARAAALDTSHAKVALHLHFLPETKSLKNFQSSHK